MKRLFYLFFVCSAALVGCDGGSNDKEDKKNNSSEFTAIPDQNFEQALIKLGYDDLIDGYVLKTGIKNCKELNISRWNISDLTGIEAFTALEKLHCDVNRLTSLDLSKNTALTELDCSVNKLTSLNLSKNSALTSLNCENNQLTTLNVSKNTALFRFNSNKNQLTSLDISKNTKLKKLYCYDNQLTSLDLSNNTALVFLACQENKIDCEDLSWALKQLKIELVYFECD